MKKEVINWDDKPKTTAKKKPKGEKAPYNTPTADAKGFIWGQFMPLGWDSEERVQNYYFFVNSCKSIVRLSASKMTKQNLLMLAPLEMWVTGFPKGESFDHLSAVDLLITLCNMKGYFENDKVRGRGAWIDNEQVVIHAGTHLIIDGAKHTLGSVKTQYVYEMRSPIQFELESPMPKAESARLTKMLGQLNFSSLADSKLLAGWIALAPICGVLQWRPHIWITGSKGNGKSWLLDDVIIPMTEGVGLRFQGDTTAMGLMQKLNNDAFAVTFDEAEGNSEIDATRMQKIMSVCRSASTHEGAPQVKGSKDGTAREYIVRSCFLFASINPQITLDSDKRRFCILELRKLADVQAFERIESARAEMINKSYSRRFQSRIIKLMPNVLKSIEMFVSAVTIATGDKATGNQIGTLLGGWWHTFNDHVVDAETALDEAIAILQLIGQAEKMQDSTDEERCLQTILSVEQRIEARDFIGTKTLGELVEIASELPSEPSITRDEANDRLMRLGLRVVKDEGVEYLAILNTSVFIRTHLQKVAPAWAISYVQVMSRIKGAKKLKPMRFAAGQQGRALGIPIIEIFKYE